jgi:hypothetical protein
MIIAKVDALSRILSGPEVQSQIDRNEYSKFSEEFKCPICDKTLIYRSNLNNRLPASFVHSDGTVDCFKSESTSEEHQLATEITLKTIYNRIREVTGEQVEIDIEKWIGIRRDFVVADIRVTSPIKLAAEVFYKVEYLALNRRFQTMFDKGYQTYLIFHKDGRHNIDQIENHIQRVAPLRIGRFDPATLETTLGDLFSKQQIEMSDSNRERLPDYIVAG